MKQEKVDFISNQVGYGRGQGLKAGVLAFLAFSVVFAGLFIADPFGFTQERPVSAMECILNPFQYGGVPTGWFALGEDNTVVCRDKSFTQVYLNYPALFAYFWLAVITFIITLSMLALVCYPKKFEKQLARNITIFGDRQVFPDFDEED